MEIWERDTYKTPIRSVFNRSIIEYDMKSANTSLAREFDLLPEDKIRQIEAMDKQKRVITIGCLKRDDTSYNEREKVAFAAARKLFFDQNDISENDIVAIKKDAIFTMKYVEHEKVGKYINFRKKHEYTSFLNLKPLEVYYNKEGLCIKGMDDEMYKSFHSEYFGSLISDIIRRMENGDKASTLKYLRTIFDMYKWRKLEKFYYREFNNMSMYRYLDGELSGEDYRDDILQLDIGYNFKILTTIASMIV